MILLHQKTFVLSAEACPLVFHYIDLSSCFDHKCKNLTYYKHFMKGVNVNKLNLRSLNEVNVGEQVSKMVVVHSRAPTGRKCIRYVIQKCTLLRMQYVYRTTRAKTWKIGSRLCLGDHSVVQELNRTTECG